MPAPPRIPRGLYVITDGPRDDLAEACDAALRGGARILQYRDKTGDTGRRLQEARRLAGLCAAHDALFLVNDDVELAHASGAGGVHLGRDDMPVRAARAQLGPDAVIGATCHASLAAARAAVAAGADYVAFGAFHPSPTKPAAARATPSVLREARGLGLPLVAVGGITPDNGAALIAAGADCLAVVSAVFGTADITAAARRFAHLFDS